MSTPEIIRNVDPGMPEEFKYRCSSCHEIWHETHIECDACHRMVDMDVELIHRDRYVDVYLCGECKDKHGYI